MIQGSICHLILNLVKKMLFYFLMRFVVNDEIIALTCINDNLISFLWCNFVEYQSPQVSQRRESQIRLKKEINKENKQFPGLKMSVVNQINMMQIKW